MFLSFIQYGEIRYIPAMQCLETIELSNIEQERYWTPCSLIKWKIKLKQSFYKLSNDVTRLGFTPETGVTRFGFTPENQSFLSFGFFVFNHVRVINN